MTTLKKKHLIELMIEAGVKWPEGAEYAAQDKDQEPGDPELDVTNIVSFYYSKPEKNYGDPFWLGDCDDNNDVKLPSLCTNWHQTIVTRKQYEKALADASMGQDSEIPSNAPVNIQSETKSTVTSLTLEELLANYQRYQQLAAEALQALQNKGKQLGLVITVSEPK